MSNDNDQFIFHSPNPPVVCGNFLSEIGGIDWSEQTTLTQMNDDGIDGDAEENDGVYTFQTDIPEGNYAFKIVLNNNWDQNPTTSDIPLNLSVDSNVTFYYNMVENIVNMEIAGTSTDDVLNAKESLKLEVYPNPFNPITTINYQLAETGNVELKVYNIKGQIVQTLVKEQKPSGKHSVTWNAENIASGIYFIKIRTGDIQQFKKIVLIK